MQSNSQESLVKNTQPALLVSASEAAHLLGVSSRFVRLLWVRGQIPVVKLGRRRLLRRSDLEALIARGGLPGAA
ncbi:MAG: helix-turn-helix domain-containing protein [Polyangia bacterium]